MVVFTLAYKKRTYGVLKRLMRAVVTTGPRGACGRYTHHLLMEQSSHSIKYAGMPAEGVVYTAWGVREQEMLKQRVSFKEFESPFLSEKEM